MKALIVTVSYRNAQETVQFLESVSRLSGFGDLEVVVVDNASEDASLATISRRAEGFSNVRCIRAPRNLGYFGGAKWGLQQYAANAELPEWVIVCNNDILFPDTQFLTKLFAQPQDVGVIAPRIVSVNSAYEQNPFMLSRPNRLKLLQMRFWSSTLAFCRLQSVISVRLRAAKMAIRRVKKHKAPVRGRIYAPHGAFIVFSRQFFERGGFLDDGVFLYAEEISVAETAARLGLPVVFEPSIEVLHNEHATTGRTVTLTNLVYRQDALRYLVEQYWQDIR